MASVPRLNKIEHEHKFNLEVDNSFKYSEFQNTGALSLQKSYG